MCVYARRHAAQQSWMLSIASWVIATGGEEEAEAAYEEAMQAIFGLQLERFSHVQPHRNPENDKVRWECLEMWPMKVLLVQLVCCEGTVIHNRHMFWRRKL